MPALWPAMIFDDTTWTQGATPIGIGSDPALKTRIDPALLAVTSAGTPQVYLRHTFDLGADADLIQEVSLQLAAHGPYDAYLNGQKVLSASTGTQSSQIAVPGGALHPGSNVLGLEVQPIVDSDFALSPELDGIRGTTAAEPVSQVMKGPYVVAPTPTSLTVVWETATAITSQALVNGQSYDGGSGTHHQVVVSGLGPSQQYNYHVETDGQSSEEAVSSTAALPGGRVRFVVYGDSRTNGDTHRRIAEAAAAESPDFVVTTGDLVASSSDAEWQTFFDIEYRLLQKVPMYPTLGDHEDSSSDGAARLATLFPMPNSFAPNVYSADYGDVHVAVLNSMGNLSDQTSWLESDLAAADARGMLHEFIFMHWGPYSSGTVVSHGSNPDAHDLIVPIARRHRVDAFMSGHDHFYERGASGDLRYFVSGGAGAPLYSNNPIPEARRIANSHHYIVVDVQGATVTTTAKDPNGSVLDQTSWTRP